MKLENNEICRIVDGDEIAFNRFMEHYSSRLYHYTFALLGQKESAEEIVSDVFFEVWKNRKSLAEIGNMNAWTILMLAICVFLIFRIIHIYITITSSLDIRLLYFGMIFCEIVLSGIGFFYTPILLFLGLIFAMLIGFPFLFHKLSLLKN